MDSQIFGGDMEGGPVAADLSSGAVRTIPVTARLPSLRESNVTRIFSATLSTVGGRKRIDKVPRATGAYAL